MSNARILKGKHFGISAYLPKEIVDRRKKLLQRKRARQPILGELSLINCLSRADYFRPRCASKTMLFFYSSLFCNLTESQR